MLKNKMINVVTLSTVDDKNEIKGIANSLTKTRNGITITEDAVSGLAGKKVPLLANHKWDSQPIGAVTIGDADKEGLHYEGKIFDNAPDRDLILEAIQNGVESVSIGFKVLDYEGQTVNQLDLLELSVTPVPADSKATVEVLEMDNDKEKQNNTTDNKEQQPESNDKKTDSQEKSSDQVIADAITAGFKSLVEALSNKDDSTKTADDSEDDEDKVDTEKEAMKEQLKVVLQTSPSAFTYENYRKVKKLVAD